MNQPIMILISRSEDIFIHQPNPMRLPVPIMDLAALPSDFCPSTTPESLAVTACYHDEVCFQIQAIKVAATQFPEDRYFKS